MSLLSSIFLMTVSILLVWVSLLSLLQGKLNVIPAVVGVAITLFVSKSYLGKFFL